MLLSWKDGEIVLEIKLNLFHNILVSDRAKMWVDLYIQRSWGEGGTESME